MPSNSNGASVAGRVIAFFGILVIVVGLVLYFYVETIGILRFYVHRDLGVLLIPTGIALLFGGIALHSVQKKETIVVVADQSGASVKDSSKRQPRLSDSPPVSVEEKPKSGVRDINILKSSQSETEARIENIIQETSIIQHVLLEAKAAADRGELGAEAFGELETNKLREIDRLKQQRAQEEASLFELGMEIKKKRSEMEEVFSKLDEEWDRFLCSSCFGSGIRVDREYCENYIILLGDSSRKCTVCDGSGRTDLWVMLTEDEKETVEVGRNEIVRERTEWYSSELEKPRDNVPKPPRRKIQHTLQTLSNIRRATATGDEKPLVTCRNCGSENLKVFGDGSGFCEDCEASFQSPFS